MGEVGLLGVWVARFVMMVIIFTVVIIIMLILSILGQLIKQSIADINIINRRTTNI